jgi:diamine N-acetyltransferase
VFITNLGVVLGRMGRIQEARAEFYRALAISPNFQPARANLAVLDQIELQGKK